jgi:hypothetical protein
MVDREGDTKGASRHTVRTDAARSARIGSAFVDVGLTEKTGIASNTRASEAVQAVKTGRAVERARIGSTLINVGLAERADNPNRA